MAKCILCGKNEGSSVHVRAGLLYQPFRGPFTVSVCDKCMRDRACPGQCTGGYFRDKGAPDRRRCFVCGGTGSFDYSEIKGSLTLI